MQIVLPPFKISVKSFSDRGSVTGQNYPLPPASQCIVVACPSSEKKMAFIHINEHGTFDVTQTVSEFRDDYQQECILLTPGLSCRFIAPGNCSIGSQVQCMQHMFTETLELTEIPTIIRHGYIQKIIKTKEDAMSYQTTFEFEMNQINISLLQEAHNALRIHFDEIFHVHAQFPLRLTEIIHIMKMGMESRDAKVAQTSAKICRQGQPLTWELHTTRLGKDFDCDMTQQNEMRVTAVLLNLPFYTQQFVLIIGGMLTNVAQQMGRPMTDSINLEHGLNEFIRDKIALKEKFEFAVQQYAAHTMTYVNDPSWTCVGIGLGAGDDQELLGAIAPENIINLHLRQFIPADCEDAAAAILAIMNLTVLEKKIFSKALMDAIDSLPSNYNTSPAAGDYTIHRKNLILLGNAIFDAYQVEDTLHKTLDSVSIQCNSDLRNVLSNCNGIPIQNTTTLASILASAPQLSASVQLTTTSSIGINNIKDYTTQWQMGVDEMQHHGHTSLMGHAIGLQIKSSLLGVDGDVSVHKIHNFRILEGTALATETAMTGNVVVDVACNHPDSQFRKGIQNTLDSLNEPLSSVMATNLVGTILGKELQVILEKTGDVVATQVYAQQSKRVNEDKCIGDPFYKVAISSEFAFATLCQNSGCLFPGMPMDIKTIPDTVTLGFQARMLPEEKLATALMAVRTNAHRIDAKTAGAIMPELNPLMGRMTFTPSESHGDIRVQPVAPTELPATGHVLGCVIKAFIPEETSLETWTGDMTKRVHEVYGSAHVHLTPGAHQGSMTVTTRMN